MQKILVIEDEELIRQRIVALLKQEGYQVADAQDGMTGLEVAYKHRPDLILCDVSMPEMDGWGVLERLRQDSTLVSTRFIFLTGLSQKHDLRHGMELGADDYVTKPFTRAEILGAISTQLNKREVFRRATEKKLEDLRANITRALPHEYFTPLSIIQMCSEMLVSSIEQMDSKMINQTAGRIFKASQRLEKLIKNFLLYGDLLSYVGSSSRLVTLQQGRVPLSRFIITEQAQYQAEVSGRMADLKLDLEDAVVNMGMVHFTKLVEELISNAFKYSEKGEFVTVMARRESNCLRLTITDQGRGMTEEQIADVGAYMQFERLSYEQQGAGLGLAIVKLLMELYNGSFSIQSVPGQHTRVEITLPVS